MRACTLSSKTLVTVFCFLSSHSPAEQELINGEPAAEALPFIMQNVGVDEYPKEHGANMKNDIDLDADSDVQQVQARKYDPHNGQRTLQHTERLWKHC